MPMFTHQTYRFLNRLAIALAATVSLPLLAAEPLGIFDGHQDVGNPAIAGSASYDAESQTYTMTSAGINMWATSDQFHFAYKKIKGDFIVRASIEFVGEGTDLHRKIGIIARNDLTTSAAYADACVHGDTLSSLQYRSTASGATDQVVLSAYHPTDIELQRKGDVFTFSAAQFGETFKSVSKELPLNDEAFVGLFICSHNAEVKETALFRNVRIVIPAPDDFRPYQDYLGSHIEVMDVQSGHRKILHSAPNSLQAPNWTADGKYLIYNSEGLLYRYQFSDGAVTELNTGFANQNNNDHVLAPDGKHIAISHHVGESRTSTIFTLPLTGTDTPTQVTDPAKGHSFLHSYSPDGKNLIFTGQRNGQYDIWSINRKTKVETQLTNLATLDDGSEYSPDGKWIYFNSVRTGTMQIWRMKPNGSAQEQVTFDAYNDWFPHFSPDGKWIVYVSFPPDIDPTDHPFYKKIYLRLMPTSGGVPKTIAYIYGGQGTINTPSWSPDSKRIAFISNTKL